MLVKLKAGSPATLAEVLSELGYLVHQWAEGGHDVIGAVRCLDSSPFPRVHVKVDVYNEKQQSFEVDVHIDTRKPMHSGMWGPCSEPNSKRAQDALKELTASLRHSRRKRAVRAAHSAQSPT